MVLGGALMRIVNSGLCGLSIVKGLPKDGEGTVKRWTCLNFIEMVLVGQVLLGALRMSDELD